MPTYEYECKRTGKRFERFQKMSDEPLKKCPECGGPARRVISAGAGVIVKGSNGSGRAPTNAHPTRSKAPPSSLASIIDRGRGVPRIGPLPSMARKPSMTARCGGMILASLNKLRLMALYP